MTITIKGVPPSLNQFVGRENTWDYRNEKADWTRRVFFTARASKDKPKRPYPFAAVTISYHFPNKNRHDADNYCGKFLLDGLTKSGIIVDDDFKHISLSVRGFYDKENPRTEISVTEV